MAVVATEHIRKMRGGANAHLMRASDDHYYVVKFRNNPQHSRILVNELISCVLLEYLELPIPKWDIVEVPEDLIEASPGLTMEAGWTIRKCEAGLHFGSRSPVGSGRAARGLLGQAPRGSDRPCSRCGRRTGRSRRARPATGSASAPRRRTRRPDPCTSAQGRRPRGP